MVLHEHLNYFDRQSLENVVRSAGFKPLRIESAKHGGVLLCCAVVDNDMPRPLMDKSRDKFNSFCVNANRALENFKAKASVSGELGIYVPLRAFPYLSQISPDQVIRFFDDDPGLRGCYYDVQDASVENATDLLANPPERVLICSLAFGDRIAARLREISDKQLDIVLWSELFAGPGRPDV